MKQDIINYLAPEFVPSRPAFRALLTPDSTVGAKSLTANSISIDDFGMMLVTVTNWNLSLQY